jgi:hypothetical protein
MNVLVEKSSGGRWVRRSVRDLLLSNTNCRNSGRIRAVRADILVNPDCLAPSAATFLGKGLV